ncbi:endolytic transglycosylase MltG [Microbacteriaceae bacterium 4G12]
MVDFSEQHKKKRRRRIVVVILALVLIVGISAYVYISSALKPLQAGNKKEIEVTIPSGTSTSNIGNILEKKGIIKNGTIFQYYVKANYKQGLQAGTYLLSPSMSLQEITEEMIAGKVHRAVIHKLAIPEGSQLVEIAEAIAKEFQMNKDDVLRQLNDKAFVQQLQAKYPKLLTNKIMDPSVKYPLEGYLFPATYSYYKKDNTLEAIITPMLEKSNEFVVKNEAAIQARKLDVHQMFTLGSLIEEEATQATDRQKIASVFYNRLAANMPLQTDPTVLYALGKHKERVLYEDLKVNSPYNTYTVKGMPPGPISNAGEPSLQAALAPAQTDFYYFLAAPSGEVFFSKTLQEHNALKAKYITKNS